MAEQYPSIVPYLLVRDGAAAIDFLRRAFGAEETLRVPGEDGRAVQHAEVGVGEGLVMVGEPPGGEGAADPGATNPVGIMVRLPAPAEVDSLHARAVEAGGTSTIPPRDEPWGARFAGIRDPSGHHWWLHARLPG